MIELLTASVTELAARLRAREISPVELVDAHIARIQEVNPTINALVVDRFDAARAEAREAEARLADPGAPPLTGVPCSIKEFIAITGMPQSGGLLARRDYRSPRDATVVARLRAAGAIILGLTNVPEGGMWMETANHVYGRTNNPWNPRHTAGGSSGGEAALIASGGSPFGIGSDIGGSIRIPAAFCGVVGHKPTAGLVPNTGHWGADGLVTSQYLTCGPLARTTRDLPLLLSIIAGPDDIDPYATAGPLRDPDAVDVRDVVVMPVDDVGGVWVRDSVRSAIRTAADALAARGARIQRLTSRRIRDGFAIWGRAMSEASAADGTSFENTIAEGGTVALAAELVRRVRGTARHTAPVLGLIALERALSRVQRFAARLVPSALELQAELEQCLGERGVLLYPPYSRPAPRHNYPLLTPFDFVCTGVFNVVGFPGTVVPVGFDPGGLPLAVQVVARRGGDHLAIAIASALERELGSPVIARVP